ncbi:MAG: ABC transporter permease subunit, partial [Oscillospiraceae bacterium]|nr:ABC transporter permease subunit [Oscillospiraceae bacterium]
FAGRSPGIFITGFIALGVYTGAYMSEVIRSGIQSIPKGQFEAAAAQGFGYFGKMYHIILPQSIKVILPPMVTTIVNMIKNTSCLYIVGGADLLSLTYSFVTGENTGGSYAPAYILCGAMFFLMCFPLSTLASMWETSLKRRDRRVNVAKEETGVKAEEEAV